MECQDKGLELFFCHKHCFLIKLISTSAVTDEMRLGFIFFLLPLSPAVTPSNLSLPVHVNVTLKKCISKAWNASQIIMDTVIKLSVLKGSCILSHFWFLNQSAYTKNSFASKNIFTVLYSKIPVSLLLVCFVKVWKYTYYFRELTIT